jgi:hypothetical protein
MNINPKQRGQACVFNRDSQNWHCVQSLATAAPQLGQFSASAFMMILGYDENGELVNGIYRGAGDRVVA